jgi:F420-non-reducing hydrogenase iron-sulfur subunit
MQYTTDVRIIRLMCTGRVDPTMIADAFSKGIDGLMVVGCHFGDCHYITGNYQAKVKVELARKALSYGGLNPQRVSFNQCSSAEGERFVSMVSAFHRGVSDIGPLGSSDKLSGDQLTEKMLVVKTALGKEKLRWVVGKFTEFTTTGNKYGERFTEHEMWRTLDTIIIDEINTHEILREMQQGPSAVKDLALKLGQQPPRVLRYVLALQRRGLVESTGMNGSSPLYKVIDTAADAA